MNDSTLRNLTRHVLLPGLAPLAVVALYFTPKAVFGCANRGLLALGVVLVATVAALVSTVKGVAIPRQEPARRRWWLITTLILLLPVALLFGPLR